MKEQTFVDEGFRKIAGTLIPATQAVLNPAQKIYENLEETRGVMWRQMWKMLGLRSAKIRGIPCRSRFRFA